MKSVFYNTLKICLTILVSAFAAGAVPAHGDSVGVIEFFASRQDIQSRSFIATDRLLKLDGYQGPSTTIVTRQQPVGFSSDFVIVEVTATYIKSTDLSAQFDKPMTKRETVVITIECVTSKDQAASEPACGSVREIRQRAEIRFVDEFGFSSSAG